MFSVPMSYNVGLFCSYLGLLSSGAQEKPHISPALSLIPHHSVRCSVALPRA